MRRTAGIIAMLTIGLIGVGYTTYALLAPIEPISAVELPLKPVMTPPGTVTLPIEGGAAIAAAEGEQVFAGRDLDTPRALASVAKVITALVVLEVRPIAPGSDGELLTLTAADSALPARYLAMNGQTAPAPEGVSVSQRQVIELMMVRSANNYADTLAIWAFGSVADYLVAARAWLSIRGLNGITVGDATGFSLQNTGTPRTLVELARIALDNEVIARAAAMPTVAVPGVGTFATTNLALGLVGVNGLKTGTLDGIGANLLFSSTVTSNARSVDVVGVVLGVADQRAAADAVQALVTSASDDFHLVDLGTPGATVALYRSEWGDEATLRVTTPPAALVWGAMTTRAVVSAPLLIVGREPVENAELHVLFGGQRTAVALEWFGTIEPPPMEWRLMRPIELLFSD